MCPRDTQGILPDAEMSDDSDDSSDVSMSEGTSSDNDASSIDSDSDNQQQQEMIDNNEEDDDEDQVIKAIRRECEKKRDHPPPITCDDAITDICFHPFENYLVVANIVGDVTIYKYTNDENTIVNTLELHTKSCRDIEFNDDGRMLISVSKDCSIMLSNFDDGKLVRFYDNAHNVPINCLTVIDENCFATGDDDGCVKIWDLRQAQQIYRTRKNEDYISDMVTDEAKKYLLCSSGDGSLTTIDLHNRKIHMQSEEYEEELTCLGLVRTETKLLAGSSNGKLFTFNWNEFGLHCDEFPVVGKMSINDLIPVTENIVVVGCEDGNLRACHLFPNKHLGIVGQHDLSVENLDICNDGTLIASSSHNNDVKFWNIKYFEDFEKISSNKKTNKRKDFKNNLPSSKLSNAADFFSGLCS